MKKTTILLLLFSSLCVFSQNAQNGEFLKEIKPLNDKILLLQKDNIKLKADFKTLSLKFENSNKKLDSLQKLTDVNSNAIYKASNELSIKIEETGKSSQDKISAVGDSVSKNSLIGIIAVLLVMLISGVLYWLLKKAQKTDKSDFIDQLSKTKSSIEESLIKEFGKQTDLLDVELHLLEQQKNTAQKSANLEPDHSLALKVASEINLIERNIKLMDAKTKGLKQLNASVGKLKDNLAANGYEMPELLGKQFHEGMKVIVATSIPDENLEKGSEIITKILIPQVNYNDKMIQTAQIEVSVGY